MILQFVGPGAEPAAACHSRCECEVNLRLWILPVVVALLAGADTMPVRAQTAGAQNEVNAGKSSAQPVKVPLFRHVEPNPPSLDLNSVKLVRFLTDNSFPPFSYTDTNGSLTGLNVAIADAICNDLRIRCEFVVKPWNELQSSLQEGKGDAILSGVKLSESAFEKFDFTRPYFRALGRFVVRVENPIKQAEPRTLAGRRIGVRQGSAHEAFLRAHFNRAKIRPFKKSADAREALRTGSIDALFGDSVQLMFWLHGAGSKGCCRMTEGAFQDRTFLNAPLSIAVKRGNRNLREVLDHGLDRLQTSGQFARIYRNFFPQSIW